ncbi:putative F-box protein At5g47300 [Silene latifolia]|uniref:putative F-box protein At5g47300 n=1 Tax=Silene latifolia TaxID=37657 RepID=UPI003D78AE7F
MHLKLCAINVDKNKLLVSFETSRRRGNPGFMVSVRRADTLENITDNFSTLESYFLRGNCDGLLLMCRDNYHNFHAREMTIWNLSCRKSLLLPPCPFPLRNGCYYLDDFIYIFGFASESKNYKVVLFTIEDNVDVKASEMMNVAVYTLGDHQWNVRINGLGISRIYFKRMFDYIRKLGYYFQGEAHWFGNDPYGDGNLRKNPTHLVSFDFNLEKFIFLELPHRSGEQETFCWFMFSLRESLAIFCISRVSSSIWVLEQDNGKQVWTLWFSGRSSYAGFILFWSYSHTNSVVFYYESVDGSSHLRCGNKSYNLNNCRVRKSINREVGLYNYSESLVLYNGDGAEDIPPFPGI